MVKEIMERHLAQMKKGLAEASAAEWAKELEDAMHAVENVDPNLAGLEDELMEKRLRKYDVQPLGLIETEKPEGYRRFLSLQMNGASSKGTREVKVEQTISVITGMALIWSPTRNMG